MINEGRGFDFTNAITSRSRLIDKLSRRDNVPVDVVSNPDGTVVAKAEIDGNDVVYHNYTTYEYTVYPSGMPVAGPVQERSVQVEAIAPGMRIERKGSPPVVINIIHDKEKNNFLVSIDRDDVRINCNQTGNSLRGNFEAEILEPQVVRESIKNYKILFAEYSRRMQIDKYEKSAKKKVAQESVLR